MQSLYRDARQSGSFGGIAKTQLYSGKSRREVVDFLSGVDAYTLHKPTRKRFPRRAVYSKGIADLIHADIADLSHIARYNDGYQVPADRYRRVQQACMGAAAEIQDGA